MCNSMNLCVFTVIHTNYHNLILQHFHHPNKLRAYLQSFSIPAQLEAASTLLSPLLMEPYNMCSLMFAFCH